MAIKIYASLGLASTGPWGREDSRPLGSPNGKVTTTHVLVRRHSNSDFGQRLFERSHGRSRLLVMAVDDLVQ